MMLGMAAVLWVSLGSVGAGEYLRPFGAKVLDQATLDAEGFGNKDKKVMAREDDGLHITLKPGEPEAGWKTPQPLRIGGDCLITATVEIKKLPRPGQDDGVAIGLAIATQSVDQPDATLLRVVETDGKEVFRTAEKAGGMNPQAMMMMNNRRAVFNPFGGGPAKPNKPPRHTFPARGGKIRLEFRRQGPTIRYQVFDEIAALPREIGQVNLGPADLAGVKLFASNRNGAEPVDVVFRDLKIQADRLTGLGTAVRTVFGTTIHGEPTAIEGNLLLIGGGQPGQPGQPNQPGQPVVQPGARVIRTGANTTTLPGGFSITIAETDDFNDLMEGADVGEVVSEAIIEPADAEQDPPPQTKFEVKFQEVQVTPKPADAPKPAEPAKPGDAKPADAAKPGEPAKPGDAANKPKPTPPPPPPPKARVPLDELESITFERASVPSGRFIGQANIDTTCPGGKDAPKDSQVEEKKPPGQVDDFTAPPPGTVVPPKVVKVEPKPNGIRDLHISLAGLRPAALTQIMVQCPTDKGQAMWSLNTAGSENWPLVLKRSGDESWADLFLEPPTGDVNDKQFQITLTYGDNQNANVQVKATGHSDPKLAFDPAAPDPPLAARVFLVGDDQLYGRLEAISDETLTLVVPWGETVKVPMARVVGAYLGMPDHKESPESFAKRIKDRGTEDLLLARAKDGEVVTIGGIVEKAEGNKLTFGYQGRSRSLPLKGVEGFVLAARPDPKDAEGVRTTFALTGGLVASGRWVAIEGTNWNLETPWGQILKVPAADIRTVRTRGGQMTFLSDLTPSQVEESAYFGRKSPYRRDRNLAGDPIRLDGQSVDKGIAVHSQSALTFDLNKGYTLFETRVGFDEVGRRKGRVDCRVFADGKEIFANPDLRADRDPIKLSLPVAGAEQLKLVVDFGPDEDTGDRVLWADARLYRRTTPAELPPLPTPPPPAATEPAKPGTEPAKPGAEPAKPGTEPAKPATEPAKPAEVKPAPAPAPAAGVPAEAVPPTPPIPKTSHRSIGLAALVALALAPPVTADQDRPQPPVDIYEWSIWVGNPAQTTLNGVKATRNAMPKAVGTVRPNLEGDELGRRFPVAPVSVVQVVGDPVDDIDIDLQVKKGSVVSHWPQATERSNGLRWFRSNLLANPPAGITLGYIPDDHWFSKLRQMPGSLYVKRENRVERFLAYDAEIATPVPVKIRGGPDEYTLTNLTDARLVDVAVITPAEGGGYRIGWLDELPAAVPRDPAAAEKKKAEEEAKAKAKDKPEEKAKAAAGVFDAADAEAEKAKDKDKPKPEDEPKPVPPEADADLRARVDQALNRPVNVDVDKAPRREVLALVSSQARIRTDVDEPTLRKANIDLAQPMTMKVNGIAARDAFAEILGPAGLTYRVSDEGSLFITTAARLAESGKKVIVEGPPVKLTLAPKVETTDPSFRAQTRDALSKRLTAQGMRPELVQVVLDQYSSALFEPKEMVVLAHLSREALDELVVLDVFPSPRKVTRTALVVAHGIDPRLQDQARTLAKKLGDSSSKARDQAENQLFEMGPVAVPVLEDALREKDVEIVYRAERVLLRLNRSVP